eukprot:CAMPEP_0204602778 /NCGR_PEP_ID=MMETSP0661-20131031/56865_1 /ASSEMBLY_ACC=CAM_ASM_000606 /TAXON_ID=109239 /ORGANISM="Alexandrium margalefi, Strain AMGDE01CS-322" /LENGTH=299 /DNA_ID=CAMNT_0051613785 /DNA_START=112 /DNA_END=1012 /DNA_ORIENTATION=-
MEALVHGDAPPARRRVHHEVRPHAGAKVGDDPVVREDETSVDVEAASDQRRRRHRVLRGWDPGARGDLGALDLLVRVAHEDDSPLACGADRRAHRTLERGDVGGVRVVRPHDHHAPHRGRRVSAGEDLHHEGAVLVAHAAAPRESGRPTAGVVEERRALLVVACGASHGVARRGAVGVVHQLDDVTKVDVVATQLGVQPCLCSPPATGLLDEALPVRAPVVHADDGACAVSGLVTTAFAARYCNAFKAHRGLSCKPSAAHSSSATSAANGRSSDPSAGLTRAADKSSRRTPHGIPAMAG